MLNRDAIAALESLHVQVEMEMSAVVEAFRRCNLWYSSAESLVQMLFSLPESVAFRDAPRVDKALYGSVVKKPMYLSLIRENLSLLRYLDQHSFLADLRLIFDNCYLFHRSDPKGLMCSSAARLEIEAERRAVELRLDAPVRIEDIKQLWRDLSVNEKLEAKASIVVRYEGNDAGDKVHTEAARKRLLEYLRCMSRARQERSKQRPSAAAPYKMSQTVLASTTSTTSSAKRPRSPLAPSTAGLIKRDEITTLAPVPLPQNKHHLSFLEELSPMHDGGDSPAFPSSIQVK